MTTGQLSKTLKGYARTTLNNNYTLPVISYLFISLVYSTVSYPFEIYFQRTVQLPLLSKEGSQVSLFSLVVYFAAMLFLAFLAMLLQVGLCKILLNLSRKDEFQFQLLFYAFSHHPDKYILVAVYRMLSLPFCFPGQESVSVFYFSHGNDSSSWQHLYHPALFRVQPYPVSSARLSRAFCNARAF